MKRLLILGLLLLFGALADAATIKTIQAGATDQTVTLRIVDSSDGTPETGVVFNTSGIDLKYWRHGANSVTDITEVTQTVSGAHTDGGFVHLGLGVYRLDLPDAAVASAATAVDVFGTVTGMVVIGGTVQLSPPVTTVTNSDKSGYSLTQSFPTNFASLAITGGGAVTAGTVSDKTGYSLSQSFPTNFSSLAITGGGAVTAGTVSDKTGYSLSQSFPTNFSSLAITGGGAVTAGTVSDKSGYSVASGGINRAAFNSDTNPLFGIQASGTAQAATSTSLTLASGSVVKPGWTLNIIGGTTGAGETAVVSSVSGSGTSTPVATISGWAGGVTPTGSVGYVAYGTTVASGGSGPDAPTIADAVLDELLSGHTVSGSLGERIGRIPNSAAGGNGGLPTVDANNRIAGMQGTITTLDGLDTAQDSQHATTQGRLPSALISGRMPAQVGGYESGQAPLQPTVAGRTAGISAGGQIGIDLANVGSPSTTLTLSGTTIGTATNLTNAPTSGDLTATMKASVQTSAAAAVAAYDPPTNAEMDARTLPSASYATASALATADAVADAIKLTADKLDTALELDGSVYRYTINALEQAPAGGGGGSTDWTSDERAAIRAILGVPGSGTTPANPTVGILDTIRDDLADVPTNAELGVAIGAGDDATLAAIGALNNLSSAQAQSAAAAALAAYDPPTNAEMEARTLPSASYATASALSALSAAAAVIDSIVDQLLIGVNVSKVNNVAVCGVGTNNNPWNGCY